PRRGFTWISRKDGPFRAWVESPSPRPRSHARCWFREQSGGCARNDYLGANRLLRGHSAPPLHRPALGNTGFQPTLQFREKFGHTPRSALRVRWTKGFPDLLGIVHKR